MVKYKKEFVIKYINNNNNNEKQKQNSLDRTICQSKCIGDERQTATTTKVDKF